MKTNKFEVTDFYLNNQVEVTYGFNHVRHEYFAVIQIFDQGQYHWKSLEDVSLSHLYHKIDDAFILLETL